eukprot:Skav204777  [mRNA]  locus=scaffold763:52885:62453:+ [translate_table: standard]
MAKESDSSDDLSNCLKWLCNITDLFEKTTLQNGQSFAFEHWEPQVGLQLPVPGFLKTRRVVECLSFLVNLYAGQVLDRQSVWQEFLSVPMQTEADFLPSFVYGRADTQHHRALHRLLQYHESAAPPGVQTTEVVEALTRILGQEHLKPEQRFALQKAFLRQIRMGLPRGFYHLGREKLPWSSGTKEQQLFHRPRIFHVAAPMNRYIVLIPHSSNMHFSMSVPTSAIRSATCQVEFDTELQQLKIVIVGVPVVDRQNLNLVEKLPEKLNTRQGRETSLQPQSMRDAQQDMRPLATCEQVEDAVGGSGPFRVTAEGAALNRLQMDAVKQGLQRRFSVVQGPPGTGRAQSVNFRSVVVDESAQATEPEVVLCVMRRLDAICEGAEDRAILVGDHKQLGPVVTEHNLCKAYLTMLERPLGRNVSSQIESTAVIYIYILYIYI